MTKLVLSTLLLLIPFQLMGAQATVQVCVEVTVTTTPIEDAFSGFEESCFSVSQSVPEDDGFPFPSRRVISDSDTREYLYGACNGTGASLDYSIETNWRYSIDTEAFFGERAIGWVSRAGEPGRFAQKSESFTTETTGSLSDGVCADFRLEFTAAVEVGVGLDSAILSKPEGLNGLFFDQNNPGHGFDFNVIQEGGLVVYYYGHTVNGERLWLISEVYADPILFFSTIEMEMFEVTSGTFGSPIIPEASWGTLELFMRDCDSGSANLSGKDGDLEMSIVRLAGIFGMGCQ